MFKNLSNIHKGLFVSLLLFLSTIPNYIFFSGSFEASSFCITVGLSIGFYSFFDKKIIHYIMSSIFVSNVIFRLIYEEELFIESLYISLSFALVTALVVFMLAKIIPTLQPGKSFRNTLIYLAAATVSSFVASILISVIFLASDSSIDILTLFLKYFSNYFFGIFIFGNPMLYSKFYNEGFSGSFKQNIIGTIYMVIFIIVSSLLFSNTVSWFTYETFPYIFIIFYMTLSFFFTFRMIFITNIFFKLIFLMFFVNYGTELGQLYLILHFHIYLLVLSTLSTTVKRVIYELDIKNKALIESSTKLENLVYSTDSLLKLSDDILNTESKIQEDYLTRIFKIACNIFDNYDYACCYIKNEKYVNFIDAVGYDPNLLNSLKFKSNSVDVISIDNPLHIVNVDKRLMAVLGDNHTKFVEAYATLNEAIRFGIYIDENTIAGIAFDIAENSGKKFVKGEFETLQSFQKLMNSFFSMNYLSYKNISLKNDIVLSLIRTLELYDHYTGGHSEEVAHLCNEISKRLGIEENEMHDIYWAGVVHDIGKVGIDSSIINKPAKLSLEEYEMIKAHSMFGYEILNKAEDLKNIAILVKHHHEWWNGAGYPSGLKGKNIPLGSQIISVCDAVSTMAKKRPYTIVKTSKEIIEELSMYLGVQFAPEPTLQMIKFIEEGHLDKYYKNR